MSTISKRVCKRGLVTRDTVLCIGTDIWLMICMYLDHSPHAVFKLLMANKSLLQAPSAQWWKQFYEQVVKYQQNLKRSSFLRKLVCHSPHQGTDYYPFDAKKTIGLAFGTHCQFCGIRHGHTFIKPLMIRACGKCLHLTLISNGELEFTFGISYSDFIEEYHEKGGITIPKECFQIQRSHLYAMDKGSSVFFQKKELSLMLGIDYEVQKALQSKRRAAAQFLTSRISRLADSIQVNKYFKKYSRVSTKISILEKVHRHSWNSNLRAHMPFRTFDLWIPGGPRYAFKYKGLFPKCRPGFSTFRCSNIIFITFDIYQSTLHLGLLPPPPLLATSQHQPQEIVTMA